MFTNNDLLSWQLEGQTVRYYSQTYGRTCLCTHTHKVNVWNFIGSATHSAWWAFCRPQERSRRRQWWPFRHVGRPQSCQSWHRAGRGRTQSHCWWAARQCPSAGVPSLPSSPTAHCRSSTDPHLRSWQLPRAHMLPGTWRTATLHLTESSGKEKQMSVEDSLFKNKQKKKNR